MGNNDVQTADTMTTKIWWKVKENLKKWKDNALSGGTNPDALLFYFCGHGGANTNGVYSIPKFQLLPSESRLLLVGYVPIESSAVFEEFGDTHIFSGTVGNISVDEEGVPSILSLRNNSEINMLGWEHQCGGRRSLWQRRGQDVQGWNHANHLQGDL